MLNAYVHIFTLNKYGLSFEKFTTLQNDVSVPTVTRILMIVFSKKKKIARRGDEGIPKRKSKNNISKTDKGFSSLSGQDKSSGTGLIRLVWAFKPGEAVARVAKLL